MNIIDFHPQHHCLVCLQIVSSFISSLSETLPSIPWLKKGREHTRQGNSYFLHKTHFTVLAGSFVCRHCYIYSTALIYGTFQSHRCVSTLLQGLIHCQAPRAHPEVKLLVLLSATFLVSPLESYHLVTTCQELSHRP